MWRLGLALLATTSCVSDDIDSTEDVDDEGSSVSEVTAAATTAGGVPLPTGWGLRGSHRFGTGSNQTIKTFADLHARYYEGQVYNRLSTGLVKIPNVVINSEQQTYVHFEQAIAFASDHITLQARGHADGSITSAELVSKWHSRNFCVEARYRTSSVPYAWPAYWFYGDGAGHDASEIDVEQPNVVEPARGLLGVHDVSMANHPSNGTITASDPRFKAAAMRWTDASFNASTAPHRYTTCYDDSQAALRRYIDGKLAYAAKWKWNASLGGTGHGPDASVIFNLAVGGVWTGDAPSPSTFRADYELYSVEFYGPL